MRRVLLLSCCLLLLAVALPGLVQAVNNPRLLDEPGLRAAAEGRDIPPAFRPAPRHLTPLEAESGLAPAGPTPYVRPAEFSALFEFEGSRAELEAAGIRVQTQVGKYFTARLRPEEVRNLTAVAGIHNARLGRPMVPHLNASIPECRADLLHGTPSGSPPVYPGETGAGVIIGDVDSGIDWSNAEFKDPVSGLTRILYIWDQTGTGTPPAGFSYGTEWTSTQINNATCTESDTDGHGTNCAGAMIGNGANTGCSKAAWRFVGMAPNANFIEVKTDYYDASIIDGVNYIFQKAAALGKDAVVNLSLGGTFSPHDGSDAMGQAINALTGPGKIVVASAGNANGTAAQGGAQHGLLTTAAGQDSFTVAIPSYTANTGTFNDFILICGWYDPSVSMTIQVKGPNAGDTMSVGFGNAKDRQLTAVTNKGGKLMVVNQNSNLGYGGTATMREFEIELYDSVANNAPRNGTWRILPITNSGSPTGKRVDIWIYLQQLGASGAWASVSRHVDYTTLVGSPGDADSVIAVGCYSTKLSVPHCTGSPSTYTGNSLYQIAYFSSVGPRRDGVLKPELTGSGYMVSMTHSSGAGTLSNSGADDDGVHQVNAGTSFSAPHVTAATAMWMKYRKHASPSLARLSLEKTCRTDGFTGVVPNTSYGWGKLDAYGLFDHKAPTVSVTAPVGGENWDVGSSHNITWSASDSVGVDSVALAYSVDNGAHWIPVAANLPNSGSYSWNVPTPSTSQALVRVTAIDVFTNRGAAQSPNTFSIHVPVPVQLSEVVAAPEHGYVDVSWSAFFDAAPRFQVFRSTARAGTYEAVSGVLDGVGKHEFSFRDRTATQPATEYFYKVGYSETGAWVYSSPIRVVTPAAVF
ncbi:MAG TPA: S8 family serine peptidase, partial [Candidatus Saccharimonadales bacterium]|nr:S8 family serine peptidase [Candidatus Saccharimonadales bacterium]